ncbi:hypothetical protein EYZ11_013496 [Aspergillus tanneri]|uniref:Inner centromere protein ARK-binding domain-containing protein n=1 Tax=Aspergillus tanneri TaxID=1220188 RepID=A0A4S3IZS3_9EURO|nr:uncharacterized protein ATNIH1004_000849 [Aspergillus tanneri]KAA8651949.1 hypothetical protein ATNIH1004_000849 [Aspergillus tanneri]THC87058.1 hypothetical protein EYZ11_013496 [Aspergillus tanneri]
MNPYLSWAILLVVAGGLGWYYNGPTPKINAPFKPVVEKTEITSAVKKPKRKARKSPEPSSSPAPKIEQKSTYEPAAQESDKPDEEIDQKEMAKRFTAVKNGTIAQSSDSGSKSQKKKNNKRATLNQPENGNSERSASRVSTRTSSTTGADADDDLSPAGSPSVNATVPSTGYVSDMLEAPAPGASVLRVTGSMDQESQKKKQKPQSFKQVETKKQRQQRLKNEARKQQVQEAEEQRRKLLEKQRHTAREAERQETPQAKPASQTSAWQTKIASNSSNGASQAAAKVDLLDTFEPESKSSQPAPSGEWDQGLPSEEEQMRILGAGDDQWTTVSSKKIKKKGGKDESEASAPETQPTATSAPAPVEPKVKVTPTYLPDILRSKQKGHPLDSDWAA